MTAPTSLNAFLVSYAGGDPLRTSVAQTIGALASASRKLRDVIREGGFHDLLQSVRPTVNADGDTQTPLDLVADRLLLDALKLAPVGAYASEELAEPVVLDPDRPLAVAIDPLDGSSNIDTNLAIGTIFSILPFQKDGGDPLASFLQPGTSQLAAGFVTYGPRMVLVLSVGSGTHIFQYSSRLGDYVEATASVAIPDRASEFAINAANSRHWDEAVRLYVNDCLEGEGGPRGRNFNMRWIASLVAEAFRIFVRGGVFLYPGDGRKGYRQGRLRLVYEANPMAMLVEAAGGAATDGERRILEIVPEKLHQRTPLVFGSKREVDRIARYHREPSLISERAPLFATRGLFRV